MKEINEVLQKNFDRMQATGKLFRSTIGGNQLWDAWYSGFENDPVFRKADSSVHNCVTCHSFIKAYGNVIAFDENYNLMTIWDGEVPEEYKKSCKNCSDLLRTGQIANIFVETHEHLKFMEYEVNSVGNRHAARNDQEKYALGISHNFAEFLEGEGTVIPHKVYKFEHLHLSLDKRFVVKRRDVYGRDMSIEAIIGEFRSKFGVFKRLLNEVKVETLRKVYDKFKSNELLRPEDNLPKIEKLLEQSSVYETLDSSKMDTWLWVNAYNYTIIGSSVRNLITELDLVLGNAAEEQRVINAYNQMVDPVNYQKQQRLASERQIQLAKKAFEEQGYMESFNRRCATIDDIEPELIEHLHNVEQKKATLFDAVPTASKKAMKFDNVPEYTYNEFKDLIEGAKTVELYLENRLVPNLVTLTTSENKNAKNIFKWPNNFAWTYRGGIAGVSKIKEAVKNAGGFVNAPFRCSLLWNDAETRGIVDLDLHAVDPRGNHIYFGSFRGSPCSSGGMLDIDMINPQNIGVENIFWRNENIPDGCYRFYVYNYNGNHVEGCKAEIFFHGKVWTFHVKHPIHQDVEFAKIYIKNGQIDIEKTNINSQYLTSNDGMSDSMKVWGLTTNEFQTVTLMCVSPNYWHAHVGVKENFFFLKDCKSEDKIKAFHVEHLNAECSAHKRVLDFLPAYCESVDGQLSGIGFNNSTENHAFFRIDGKRVVRVNF